MRRLTILLIICTICGCTSKQPMAGQKTEWAKFTDKIDLSAPGVVESAVRNAVASDYAIVYVHVDFSPFDMRIASPIFLEFANRYVVSSAQPEIGYHYIDFSSVSDGYAPLRSISGWKELERARGGGSLIDGGGEMIWMERGRVIDVERIGHGSDPDTYIAKAIRLWGEGL